MFDLILFLAQALFTILMIGLLLLLFAHLLLAWAWAQSLGQVPEKRPKLSALLSIAAVEWGAAVTLLAGLFFRMDPVNESPRLGAKDLEGPIRPTQRPIIFVSSLHGHVRLFRLLYWRLRNHHFTSLWPFSFRAFVQDSIFLEEQLFKYIQNVLAQTGAIEFALVSFGDSRPLVGRVLSRKEFLNHKCKWFAISAPETLSSTMKFLETSRVQSVYEHQKPILHPDFLCYGEKDTIAYPESVYNGAKVILVIPDVGHWGVLIHSKTVQSLLLELDSAKAKANQERLAGASLIS